MICPYCETLVKKGDKSRTVHYGMEYPPIIDYAQPYGCMYHSDCYNEWRTNCEKFYVELDRPMNNCVYFQRTGSSMFGYYLRDGKKHACLAQWRDADIFRTAVFLYQITETRLDFDFVNIVISDPGEFLESFRRFLHKNGWFPDWYQERKPTEYFEPVLERRRNESLSR